jgi:hypothetical protein
MARYKKAPTTNVGATRNAFMAIIKKRIKVIMAAMVNGEWSMVNTEPVIFYRLFVRVNIEYNYR